MRDRLEKLAVLFLYWRGCFPEHWGMVCEVFKMIGLSVLSVVSMWLLFTLCPDAVVQIIIMAAVVSGLVWCLRWDD
jgi:hypothetical protein